ncbi:MAG TPA: ABC transporter substrate-binding protein [Nitrospiria bacterium]|nr:ABC transporter substrate-binding protein [Nitrospiria bacterium]
MSNALSGPASALGTGMKIGATVYFDKINAGGGIHGRKIMLVTYDDGYEPDKAISNTRKLIEEDKVFALFGYVGTPTSSAVMPIFSKAGVPYIAPFTGAEILRNPVNKVLFNIRASYFDETEAMVEHLTKDLGIKKIGVFVQADAFGDAGRAGVVRALRKRDMSLVGDSKFPRNTVDVDEGLEALIKANPEAVIMVGTYKPCAAFIKKAKARGFNPKFLNVSFVGTDALIQELGKDGNGVIVTQVMPNPTDSALTVVKQYLSDMKAAGQRPDFMSLEGYVDAVVMVEALKKTSPLTRASFISTFEGLKMNAGGLNVSFSSNNHQGLDQIFLTKIQNEKAVTITRFE